MDMTTFHTRGDHGAAFPKVAVPVVPLHLAAWFAASPGPAVDPAERRALAELLPRFGAELARRSDPVATLAWLDTIICRIPPDDRLFARLAQAPDRLAGLSSLPERAPRLARILGCNPRLAGQWLVSRGMDDRPGAEATAAGWENLAGPAVDVMATVAAETHACRFAMEMAVLDGIADPLALARANTALADGALRTAHRLAMAELRERHGEAGGELVVMAMGRFGGAELTAQSDLDLVFLFTGDGTAMTDGRRPLDTAEYFDRAAALVTRHLATHSILGALYEVDTRLRPWGDKGPRACSLACLDRYLGENAGVWEFMALMRARPVVGSAAARTAATTIIARHDQTVRSRAVIGEARDMRMTIARHKPPRGTLDVKLVHGGLVDLEFAVHINQLRHGIGCVPGLGRAIAALVEAGLVDPALAEAHRDLTALLTALRLVGSDADDSALPPRQAAQVAAIAGCQDWSTLMGRYKAARLTVQRVLRNTLSQPGR
jgi:glutamate-ammonia-ligase adenylyltransferase